MEIHSHKKGQELSELSKSDLIDSESDGGPVTLTKQATGQMVRNNEFSMDQADLSHIEVANDFSQQDMIIPIQNDNQHLLHRIQQNQQAYADQSPLLNAPSIIPTSTV